MSAHSPTPWRADRSEITGRAMGAVDASGRDIRLVGFSISGSETARANSDLVLRAVNSHGDLVAALRGLIDATPRDLTKEQLSALWRAETALAKAEGRRDRVETVLATHQEDDHAV